MFVSEDRPISRVCPAPRAGSRCLELGYGRFVQPDPIGYDDGLNWYEYVSDDPVNASDPRGLSTTTSVCYMGTCWYFPPDPGLPPFLPTPGTVTSVGTEHSAAPEPADGGDVVVTARRPAPQKPKPFTCGDAMKESGRITTSSISLSAVGAIGLVGGAGTWRNERTGSHGNFQTIGFGVGLAAGGTYTMPTFSSIGAFTGMSDGFSIGASFGFAGGKAGMGVGYSRSWNSSGSGGGFTFDIGSAQLPSLSLTGTWTDTRITNCQRGQ